MNNEQIVQLIDQMVEALVDDHEFEMEVTSTANTIILEVQPLNVSALKRLIGKGGEVIKTLNKFTRFVGSRNNVQVFLNVLEVQ